MPHTTPIRVVAFGDSITQASHQVPEARWPALLNQAIQLRFPECLITIINAGVGGNTTREGMQRIEKDVLAHDPDFVLAEFGNDSTPEPARHVTFEEFTANLDTIRTKTAERNNGRLILLTFPPIVDAWHCWTTDEYFKKNGGPDACQEHYRKLTRQFAQAHRLPLADIDKSLRQAMAKDGPGEYILPDGVHLTTRGNQVVADTILPVLSEEIHIFMASPPTNAHSSPRP